MIDDVHILPINDLIEHDENSECVCGPSSEPVKREDGSVGWVISHNSLDNRENNPGVHTTVKPFWGPLFTMSGVYNPTFWERVFGKKNACKCEPNRFIFPDHFDDCPMDGV